MADNTIPVLNFKNNFRLALYVLPRLEMTSGCWEWTGQLDVDGYGKGGFEGRRINIHRVMYEMMVERIPEGLYVLHKCDNRKCANPDHLFTGTQKDNIIDAMKKCRHPFGQRIGTAKFTDGQVMEIRKAHKEGANYAELGREWNVTRQAIGYIVRGDTWGHLPVLVTPRRAPSLPCKDGLAHPKE